MIFKNALVLNENFCFEKLDIQTENDKIKKINPQICTDDFIDCNEKIIVPGLVDIHTHGCLGHDSSDHNGYDNINLMSRFYAAHGTTTYLATIESNSRENTLAAIKNISEAINCGVSGAGIGGIHLEGPYFSEKYKGAQNGACLRLPDIEEFKMLCRESENTIKLISLAPELCGANNFIAEASKMTSVAIGHTDADCKQAQDAISCGATVMTHTFNAMRPLHHRNPNALGAALDSDIFCEFICDGFHVDKTVIRIMYKLLGDDRMLFISDSIRAAGMPDGEYSLAGLPVFVCDGKARLENGTIAGSTVTELECVKNAISFGIPAESAFKMASLTPARACKIDSVCGSISVGKRADFLVLDKEYNLEKIILRGKFFGKDTA